MAQEPDGTGSQGAAAEDSRGRNGRGVPSPGPGSPRPDEVRRGPEAPQHHPPRDGRAAYHKREREREYLRLAELLREEVVKLPLAASDACGAVAELVNLLVAAGELPRGLAPAASLAVGEREAILPTGWKYGLAFPMGRLSGLKKIVAAVGISRQGIDFACLDRLPARIVVLLLFPDACYARFSPAVQDIADSLEDPALREILLAAAEPAEVVAAIEEAESRETA